MEDDNTSHEVNTVNDFWLQIENVLAQQCEDENHIDDALRSYLDLLQAHHEHYITTDDHLAHCAYLLYASPLFAQHASYIRRQLVYCLLQDDDAHVLSIAVIFLLADARENESTFDLLNRENTFPRLVGLIAHPQVHEEALHRSLMELLYEMARIQKISHADLTHVNDDFVCRLFDIIEQASDDVNDPYHYPVIRVLLVLNEQFMVAAHEPAVVSGQAVPLTNKVVKVLSSYGHRYKTFGANIILLLNREDETSLQLLTLKLMYLLFTTPPTYEYFYTNDLRVLVDILIRNLLDLPEYAAALRHTYLRVLYPLLEHTQLQHPPYYKRHEIRKLLALLCGERIEDDAGTPPVGGPWNHFEDVDETTKRLVKRCQGVSWLMDPETAELVRIESPSEAGTPEPESPISPSKPMPPQLPAPRKLRKKDSSKSSTLTIGQFLTPQLEAARHSSVSMVEMAKQKEKPGVITPSRNPNMKQGLKQTVFAKKEKPPLPQARRSAFRRPKAQSSSTELDVTRVYIAERAHTPADERTEAEKYEDAVEQQAPDAEGAKRDEIPAAPEAEGEQAPADDAEKAAPPKPQPRKPPPAPKARRGWRMRKSKDLGAEGDKEKEPGKFSTTLPSVNVSVASSFSPAADRDFEESPFSPAKDKTLDPADSSASPTMTATNESKRSVSDALNQAQAQAMQQVEKCLEGTHVNDEPTPISPTQIHPPRTSSLQHCQTQPTSPPLARTVLAPPGPAPIRGVPGPRVDVEKSPFLSEDERDKDQGRKVGEVEEPSLVTTLRTKDSWEDFDNDD